MTPPRQILPGPLHPVCCPDCDRPVAVERIKVLTTPPFGTFGQCPVCAIGSPLVEWLGRAAVRP
jgi:hypothetical protein